MGNEEENTEADEVPGIPSPCASSGFKRSAGGNGAPLDWDNLWKLVNFQTPLEGAFRVGMHLRGRT